MRVLVAPSAYRGTLTAAQAADAIAEGWRRAAPHDEVLTLPLSDGGEGFVDVLSALAGARPLATTVRGPLGDQVPGVVLLLEGPSGTIAYVEAAQACGPALLPADRRDPRRASSYGVGQLVRESVAAGASRVVVGVRDLLCNDGGYGFWSALAGRPAPGTQEDALPDVEVEDWGWLHQLRRSLVEVQLVVATPDELPLLGLQGTSAQQSPARGATPEQAQALEGRLGALVDAVGRVLPGPTDLLTGRRRRLDKLTGAGAGGGLGYGVLVLGGSIQPVGETLAAALDLDGAVAACDLVVTGEGRLDWASLRGRVAAVVGETALRHARPAIVIPGQSLVGRRECAAIGVTGIYPVADTLTAVPRSMADPAGTLSARATRVARTWSPAPPSPATG
ncbi:glycerate kinase [uncultured Arsenicicoccus sp.]|uniref:glycerate kinase n=1 Tax=uncultured Arsenicicoccus sp. TaxID=491339 RepID=UPI00259784F0|nr:glycerate kinase [uncultured Arsenicicoccus sp.]